MQTNIPLLNGCDPRVARMLVPGARAAVLRTDAGPEVYVEDVLNLYTQDAGPWAAHSGATGYECWVCEQLSHDPLEVRRTIIAQSPMLIDRAFVSPTHATHQASFSIKDLISAVEDARRARGLSPHQTTEPPTPNSGTIRYIN